MEYTGNIRKMESALREIIFYNLPLGELKVDMNRLIGQEINMKYKGEIHCIKCGRRTNKSFAQGYCYPCFTSAPETEECILRPELCRAQEGVARDMEYAKRHCLIEHVVYLSFTSGLKVGVTRNTQVPTRWIDQGAVRVIELARTPDRYTAGLMEVSLKAHIGDKTNWRKMLSGPGNVETDLVLEKSKLTDSIPGNLKSFVTQDDHVLELVYPVSKYPEKIKSLDFHKEPHISGVLTGIKGQYLMLEGNRVINMRKFGGYLVNMRTTI